MLLLGSFTSVTICVWLCLGMLGDSVSFYVTPTELLQKHEVYGENIRLGGLVVAGSLRYKGTKAEFDLTDGTNVVHASYVGVLPNLFQEGSGAVLTGCLGEEGVFEASKVLAKHDENYRPPSL